MIGTGGHNHGWRAWRTTAACLVICAAIRPGAAAAQEPVVASVESCALSARSAPHAVIRVIDGATLALDDGTTVRLIGALAPTSLDAGAVPSNGNGGHDDVADGPNDKGTAAAASVSRAISDTLQHNWQPAVSARETLSQLVNGRSVTLATAGRQRDRYGRSLAQVFVNEPDGSTLWLQGAMLSAGQARAYGTADNFACMDAMLAAEAPARDAHRGLWANPAYAIRSAVKTRNLMRLRGTFQIVAGEVRASQQAKSGWTYLNFGKNWKSDFSASIAPDLARAHPEWAAGLLGLKGRTVRVRGWIERRNGPSINVEHPSQIELVEADETAAARTPARALSDR